MPTEELALQTWTLRRELRVNPEAVLGQVRAIGFKYLELSGTAGMPIEKFHELCARFGFKLIGIHLPPLTSGNVASLLDEMRRHCELLGSQVAIVMLDPDDRNSRDAYRRYADLCRHAADTLRGDAISLCYTCYPYDLKPFEGASDYGTGLDILLGNTEPAHLGLEFDTAWVARAGIPLEALFKKCSPRIKSLQLNDFKADGAQAPLGEGSLDWPTILDVTRNTDSLQWLIIKHDSPHPLSWIRQSHHYWHATLLTSARR